jgi:ketosteroid isomerase-like protein
VVAVSNVEIIRGAIQRFNEHGIEASFDIYRDDFEWHSPPEWPEDEVYRGHAGLAKLADSWTQNFDEYRWHPERFLAQGDKVVALVHHRGRTRNEGVWIEQPIGAVFIMREGLVDHVYGFFSWAEALDFAGIREPARQGS